MGFLREKERGNSEIPSTLKKSYNFLDRCVVYLVKSDKVDSQIRRYKVMLCVVGGQSDANGGSSGFAKLFYYYTVEFAPS